MIPDGNTPMLPGLQNSWQPNAYPLPPQAPAAPAGLDPNSVYSFAGAPGAPGAPAAPASPSIGSRLPPFYRFIQNLIGGKGATTAAPAGGGYKGAQAPALPGAPGYLGPSTAMAYQMAGPRVGFQGGSVAAPGPAPGAPGGSGSGGGGVYDGGAPGPLTGGLQENLNTYLGNLSASGVPINNVTGTNINTSGGTPLVDSGGWAGLFGDKFSLAGDADLNAALGIEPPKTLSGLLGLQDASPLQTITGAPMAPSGGQWSSNIAPSASFGGNYNVGGGAAAPAFSYDASAGGGASFGSNNFGGGNWSSFGGYSPSGFGSNNFGGGNWSSFGGNLVASGGGSGSLSLDSFMKAE